MASSWQQIMKSLFGRDNRSQIGGGGNDGGYSYVFKQPTSEDEEKLCKEAMEGCPVEAIGDNGG